MAIERCQCFNAKRLQCLDLNTRSEAVTGSLALWSMEGEIDKAKLVNEFPLVKGGAFNSQYDPLISVLYSNI